MCTPQFIMVLWCMFAFVFGLCRISRADLEGGAAVITVLLYIMINAAFQGLLFWGGFYG